VIWRGIGRILVVGFGFILALAAAASTMVLIGGRWAAAEVSAGVRGDEMFDTVWNILDAMVFAFSVAPALTLTPALLVVIIGEVLRIRSALYYVAASGAAASAVPLATASLNLGAPLIPHSQYLAVMATAGFAAGFVYWVVAGRNA
jgi:hypothetical protein